MRTRSHHLILGLGALALLTACNSGPNPEEARLLKDHQAMLAADSAERAVQQAREEGVRAVFKMFETGNPEGAENYMTEDMVEHTPPPGMEVKGVQGFKDMVTMMSEGWSDNKFTVHSFAHQGDTLFAHYTWTGRNTGEMIPGVPATNKTVSADGVEVLKYDGTKATEHWGFFEETKMMTQLGLMPDPSAPKK